MEAHAWVAGLVPGQGEREATDHHFSITVLFLYVSVPPFPSP